MKESRRHFLQRAGIDEAAFAELRTRLIERIRTHGTSWKKPLVASMFKQRADQRAALADWAVCNLSNFPNHVPQSVVHTHWFKYVTSLAPMVFELETRALTFRVNLTASTTDVDRPVRQHSNGRILCSASGPVTISNIRRRFIERAGIDDTTFDELSSQLFEQMLARGPSAPTPGAWQETCDTPEMDTRVLERKSLARWAVRHLSSLAHGIPKMELYTYWFTYITAGLIAMTEHTKQQQASHAGHEFRLIGADCAIPQPTLDSPEPEVKQEESDDLEISLDGSATTKKEQVPAHNPSEQYVPCTAGYVERAVPHIASEPSPTTEIKQDECFIMLSDDGDDDDDERDNNDGGVKL